MARSLSRPRGRRSVLCLTAALTAAVLGLAGCRGGSSTPAAAGTHSGPAPSSTTSSTTSGVPAGSAAPSGASSGSAAGASSGLTQAQAQAALLTRAEIGNGLVPTAPYDATQPFPCTPGKAPLTQTLPAPVHAVVSYADAADDFEVTERIDNYADPARTQRALTLTENGLACTTGSLGSIPVTIGAPSDLSRHLTTDVDLSRAWEITGAGAAQSYIVTKIDTELVTLIFGETGEATTQSVDAAGIVQKAIAKVGSATQ